MHKTTIVMAMLCTFIARVQAIPKAEIIKVRDQLINTIGDRKILKPDVEISTETNVVAAYYHRRNVIVIESKALAVCRSFGQDSLNALAFILGHELIHAYQGGKGDCAASANYLAWASDAGQEKLMEHDADIGGVFLAYMAGYRTVQIVPRIIEKIYQTYQLRDERLTRYLPIHERKATAEIVLSKIEKLIVLFDAATFLTAIGQHQEAIAAYQQILPYYKGVEVINNLGLNYVLSALNEGPVNTLAWAIPLELDANTRLNKPVVSRGDDEEYIRIEAKQKQLLQEARRKFKEVVEMDHDYYPAVFNLLTTNILLGKADSILVKSATSSLASRITFFNKSQTVDRDKEMLELIRAFALAESGKQQEARAIWKKLENSPYRGIAWQAAYNTQVSQQIKPAKPQTIDCAYVPDLLRKHVDDIRLHAYAADGIPQFRDQLSQFSMYLTQHQSSWVVAFYIGKKKKSVVQIVNNIHKRSDFVWRELRYDDHGLLTDDGFILHCPEKKVALRVNEQTHWVTQGVRYHVFL